MMKDSSAPIHASEPLTKIESIGAHRMASGCFDALFEESLPRCCELRCLGFDPGLALRYAQDQDRRCSLRKRWMIVRRVLAVAW